MPGNLIYVMGFHPSDGRLLPTVTYNLEGWFIKFIRLMRPRKPGDPSMRLVEAATITSTSWSAD